MGKSGNVGRSMLPHLHIHVTGPGGGTIPFVFRDVERQGGIPRTLNRYTSGNTPPE